jgi:glycosyltransferase involved in cell wall biosynthesis
MGVRRIGWLLDSSTSRVWPLPWDRYSPVAEIRYLGIARYLHRTGEFHMERYRPWANYDAVVIVKVMSDPAFSAAQRLKSQGVPVIFDANVNYYEEWGEFPVPGTRPTEIQKKQVCRITELVDAVVADSSPLKTLCAKYNPNTVWIPDAVDTALYSPSDHAPATDRPVTFIWSGIGKKAYHLELIEPLLNKLAKRLRLILVPARPTVKDPAAPVIERLKTSTQAEVSYWDETPYVQLLRRADVILSPKILNSSYEIAHTEYKISLGMAAGLPALASPQPSYRDMIGDGQGGILCTTADEWAAGFERFLTDPTERQRQGIVARRVVEERYSIPVVAERYAALLRKLCAREKV